MNKHISDILLILLLLIIMIVAITLTSPLSD